MQQMYNVINEKTVSTFYLKKRISMAKKSNAVCVRGCPQKTSAGLEGHFNFHVQETEMSWSYLRDFLITLSDNKCKRVYHLTKSILLNSPNFAQNSLRLVNQEGYNSLDLEPMIFSVKKYLSTYDSCHILVPSEVVGPLNTVSVAALKSAWAALLSKHDAQLSQMAKTRRKLD